MAGYKDRPPFLSNYIRICRLINQLNELYPLLITNFPYELSFHPLPSKYPCLTFSYFRLNFRETIAYILLLEIYKIIYFQSQNILKSYRSIKSIWKFLIHQNFRV